jgi:hypothetical protein
VRAGDRAGRGAERGARTEVIRNLQQDGREGQLVCRRWERLTARKIDPPRLATGSKEEAAKTARQPSRKNGRLAQVGVVVWTLGSSETEQRRSGRGRPRVPAAVERRCRASMAWGPQCAGGLRAGRRRERRFQSRIAQAPTSTSANWPQRDGEDVAVKMGSARESGGRGVSVGEENWPRGRGRWAVGRGRKEVMGGV